jgi:homospermidine synthase
MIHYLTSNGILQKNHIVNVEIREYDFGGVNVNILDPDGRFFPIYNTYSKLYNDGFISYRDMIHYEKMPLNVTVVQLQEYYPIGSVHRAVVKEISQRHGLIDLGIDFCKNV